MLTETDVETALRANNRHSPDRITPAKLDAIVDSSIACYWRVPETTVTVCALTLPNGFTVIGKSACADPAQFLEHLGRDLALKDARQQLWELEGYALRNRLAAQGR